MSVTGLLTTNVGAAAIARDLSNVEELAFTHVAFGDANGVPYNPNVTQVALVNERYRATIAAVAVIDGAIVIDAILPADTNDAWARPSHGWNVAECALYSNKPEMIALARMGNGYKPAPASGQAVTATFRLKLAVANPSAITVVIDPQAQVILGREVRPQWIAVNEWRNDPPVNPQLGDTFLIGAAPTGAWAGFAHRVAQWVGVWSLADYFPGSIVSVNALGTADPNHYLRRIALGWESAMASDEKLGFARFATLPEAIAKAADDCAVTPEGLKEAIRLGVAQSLLVDAGGSAGTVLPSSVATKIDCLSNVTSNTFVTSTFAASRFTVGLGETGTFLAQFSIHLPLTGSFASSTLMKNTTEIAHAPLPEGNAGDATTPQGVRVFRLDTVGDFVELFGYQQTGTSRTCSANNRTNFSITRLGN